MGIDHTESFVKFWSFEFPDKPVPPVPTKPEDLSITARMALSAWDSGKLHQNLFGKASMGSQPLPADVELRRRNNELLPEDASALRAANLEHSAQEAELVGQRQQDQRFVDQAELGRKEYLQAKKQSELWGDSDFNTRLAMAPPTPESIERARAQWGITGKASWEE